MKKVYILFVIVPMLLCSCHKTAPPYNGLYLFTVTMMNKQQYKVKGRTFVIKKEFIKFYNGNPSFFYSTCYIKNTGLKSITSSAIKKKTKSKNNG